MRDSQDFLFRLSLIAALALALRVAAVLWIPTQPISDFWSFVHLAAALVRGDGYAWSPGHPTAMFAPGYPLLLAGVFTVTGPSFVVTKIVCVVLSVATVVLGGLAARELIGATAALVAALLLSIDPRQILLACLSASEHLAACTLFTFLWIMARSWKRRRGVPQAVIGGVALGVSALSRPVVFLAWPLWPLCAALARKGGKEIVVQTGVLLVIFNCLLLPWGLRNLHALGRFTTSTTNAGINLFMGNNDVSTGTWSNWQEELRAVRPETAGAPEGKVDAIAAEEGRRWIVANPERAAALYLRKLGMYFWSEGPFQVGYWAIFAKQVSPPSPPIDAIAGEHVLKRHEAEVMSVLNFSFCALIALGLLGALRLLWLAWRDPEPLWRPTSAALIGLTLYFPVVTSVFIVVDRYRWPMEDLLALLAAFGISGWSRRSERS